MNDSELGHAVTIINDTSVDYEEIGRKVRRLFTRAAWCWGFLCGVLTAFAAVAVALWGMV